MDTSYQPGEFPVEQWDTDGTLLGRYRMPAGLGRISHCVALNVGDGLVGDGVVGDGAVWALLAGAGQRAPMSLVRIGDGRVVRYRVPVGHPAVWPHPVAGIAVHDGRLLLGAGIFDDQVLVSWPLIPAHDTNADADADADVDVDAEGGDGAAPAAVEAPGTGDHRAGLAADRVQVCTASHDWPDEGATVAPFRVIAGRGSRLYLAEDYAWPANGKTDGYASFSTIDLTTQP